MRISATALTVKYRAAEHPALIEVSLTVEPGRIVAVAGPNGSGKTTLLRAMAGLLTPDTGAVLLDGVPLTRMPRRQIARRLALVAQREDPVPGLTVADAVMMGRYPHLDPLDNPRAQDRLAVNKALQLADVEYLVGRRVETLSGGEWQRVRLARALAQQCPILMADEPTAALDINHEMTWFETTRALADQGMTILIVTHNLNLAARFADHIALLDRGRLQALGTPDQVFDQALLSQVFRWPIGVHRLDDGSLQFTPIKRPAALSADPSTVSQFTTTPGA